MKEGKFRYEEGIKMSMFQNYSYWQEIGKICRKKRWEERRGDEKKSEQLKYITIKHPCVTLRTSCLNSRAPLTLSSNAASLRWTSSSLERTGSWASVYRGNEKVTREFEKKIWELSNFVISYYNGDVFIIVWNNKIR